MEIIVTSGELEDGRVTNTTEIIYTEDAIRSRKGPSMQIARKWHSIVRIRMVGIFLFAVVVMSNEILSIHVKYTQRKRF